MRATFLLHDRGSLMGKNWAQMQARFVGEPWSRPGTVPWIRHHLPGWLPSKPGVLLELSLPPLAVQSVVMATDPKLDRMTRAYAP
jgi:hypothetical protein